MWFWDLEFPWSVSCEGEFYETEAPYNPELLAEPPKHSGVFNRSSRSTSWLSSSSKDGWIIIKWEKVSVVRYYLKEESKLTFCTLITKVGDKKKERRGRVGEKKRKIQSLTSGPWHLLFLLLNAFPLLKSSLLLSVPFIVTLNIIYQIFFP